jgi:8-hydroxy-5-deazaflavin:NADPH oxidoreductase
MATVGFIGSGQLGSAIARLAIEAGHQVVLSNSRGPETLADTAAELGPRASAATSGEAAAAGDIVVVTVPVKAFPDLPAAALAGKTVIDTCNYGPERDGHIPELDSIRARPEQQTAGRTEAAQKAEGKGPVVPRNLPVSRRLRQ